MTDTDTVTDIAAPEPGASATAERAAFRLDDFATAAGPEAPNNAEPAAASRPPEPYSDEELAQITALAFGFGLPMQVLDSYTRAYVSRALPILGLLQAGEALAELGFHKGAGVGSAPAWLRAAAAGLGLGLVGVMTRREFAAKGRGGAADEGDDWTADVGAPDAGEPSGGYTGDV